MANINNSAIMMLILKFLVISQVINYISAFENRKNHRIRHQSNEIRRLREVVDRLSLKQKTDKIILNNLQYIVRELQENSEFKNDKNHNILTQDQKVSHIVSKSSDSIGRLTNSESIITVHRSVLEGLINEVSELGRGLQSVIQHQTSEDQILVMKQEIEYLRNEVKNLKSKIHSKNSENPNNQDQDKVAKQWSLASITRLQENVMELQNTFNLTRNMHEKQEIDLKLEGVREDVSALRRSLATVTSRAEGAAATAEVVQLEEERTAGQTHHTAAEVAAATANIKMLREDFNQLLDALPDGLLSTHMTQSQQMNSSSNGNMKKLEERLEKLESELKGSGNPVAVTEEKNADSTAEEPNVLPYKGQVPSGINLIDIQNRIMSNTNGLKEVKSSSVQLIAAIDNLEDSQDTFSSEIRKELAKIEFTVAKIKAEAVVNAGDNKIFQETLASLRSDLTSTNHRVDLLTFELAALQESHIETKAKEVMASSPKANSENSSKISDIRYSQSSDEERNSKLNKDQNPASKRHHRHIRRSHKKHHNKKSEEHR